MRSLFRTVSAPALALTLSMAAPPAPACPYYPLISVPSRPGAPIALPTGDSGLGVWSAPRDWPVIAIHAALMPDGRVLHYEFVGAGGSEAVLWDSVSDSFTAVDGFTDLFCSGASLLADGSLYVTGGNDYACEFQGRRDTYTFDAFTETWTQLQNMVDGRWYPTNVTLGDGRVTIFSGLRLNCELNPRVELFTPGVGLSLIAGANRFVDLYPNMHVLTSGLIAHVGPNLSTYTFDADSGVWTFVDNTFYGIHWNAPSVLIPGRTNEIMLMGGYQFISADDPTNAVESINFNDAQPEWLPLASMNIPRGHFNAVILPDKTVLAVGGGQSGLFDQPVLNSELYDPETDTWTLLPTQTNGRMYHSTAVLLPDARVLSAGQNFGDSSYTAEIYEPDYLHRGPRPAISDAPPEIGYGFTFRVSSPQAADVSAVALIAPASVTHSNNMQQRYVEIPFTRSGDDLFGVAPADGNHAPPGYYMLFVVDSDRVPSVATFVRLGDDVGCSRPAPGCDNSDVSPAAGDCIVDLSDLGVLLSNFDPLTSGKTRAQGDVFPLGGGDGFVDLSDLGQMLADFNSDCR